MKIDSKIIIKYSKCLDILYVEDDKQLRNATSKIFNTFFNRVDVAEDGELGLIKYFSYKKEHGKYYDLVITDINMPNLDGIEMGREIIQENTLQPLIYITAYNESSFLQGAIDNGADGFLSKPINPEKLQLLFYKISKSISDAKEIEDFFDKINELNAELEQQNIELKRKNLELEKSNRVLDTIVDKEQMIPAKDIEKNSSSDDIEKQYLKDQMQQFINEDLAEIQDLHSEIDSSVISVITSNGEVTDDIMEHIINGFAQYASLLSYYTFFTDLSHAMQSFSKTLSESELPDDKEKINNVFVLLESFLFVLSKWNKELENSDDAVSFFDASIISDMNTITQMWTMDDSVVDEDEDDIFF